MKELGLVAYYASYLYFLAAPVLLWAIFRLPLKWKIAASAALAPLTLLAYARFIEPRWLLTRHTDIELEGCFPEAGSLRAAVVSDMHIGMFGNAVPPARVAAAIRATRPDVALVAGDWTNYLRPEKFRRVFAPVAAVGAPMFGVLGNHDIGVPGVDVGAPLSAALSDIGVLMIDDRKERLDLPNAAVELVGLSDLWGEGQDLSLLAEESRIPRLVLTHNPASPNRFKQGTDVDLVIAGHTHGGQVHIPFVTCKVTLACKITRQGLIRRPKALTFVTRGVGMSGLPLRFHAPPRIDVLNIRYKACDAS